MRWCFTNLLEKKSGNSITVTSNCPYHYERMQYKQAATFSNTMPCINVPIHCPLCPTSVSGNPQTIWKYNTLYHLITEHCNDGIVPEIPGELLVKIFIHKQEENVLSIEEHDIQKWRRGNNISDNDGLALMMEDQPKSGRLDTVSTTLSDSHDTKRAKLTGIPEYIYSNGGKSA